MSGITLTDLAPGTKYYYQVVVTNSAGLTTGGVASFTTLQRPAIGGISLASNPNLLLHFTGTPQASYTLQSSSNLITWNTVTNLAIGADGTLLYTASATTNHPALFFRLSSP